MPIKLPGPTIQARDLPTPFGKITLPKMEPLELGRPELNARRIEAVKHGAAADFAVIFGIIPYVGGTIGAQLTDLHHYAMKDKLTDDEYDAFVESDKKIPSNGLALLHSFMKPTIRRR